MGTSASHSKIMFKKFRFRKEVGFSLRAPPRRIDPNASAHGFDVD